MRSFPVLHLLHDEEAVGAVGAVLSPQVSNRLLVEAMILFPFAEPSSP